MMRIPAPMPSVISGSMLMVEQLSDHRGMTMKSRDITQARNARALYIPVSKQNPINGDVKPVEGAVGDEPDNDSRTAEAMTDPIAPLTKCKPDGEPYRRMAAVEARLGQLIDLPWDEIVRRAVISSRAHPDYIPSECLVHLLRSTRHDNHDGRFNRLFPFLMKRFLRALPGKDQQGSEPVVINAQLNDIRDWARDRFYLLITTDRDGGDKLDFFEVHFDGAVAKLRLSARGAVGRRTRREAPIERDSETLELSPAIEAAAARDRESNEQFLLEDRFRPRLLAAIDRLPREQREVVTMIINNIQTEAKDPQTPSIAGLLGCEPRTVQNRRTRAIEALRAMLGLGDGE